MLLILTGKTASGKDTVMANVMSKLPNTKRVVTTTSRAPRIGEKNGVDYYFIPVDEFKKKITNNDFIEYVSYGGNYYGTEKIQITDNLNNNLIWRIDPSRAGQIRDFINSSYDPKMAEELLKRIKVIYLTVDNDTIVSRLKQRGLKDQEIDTRMKEDADFWNKYQSNYDYVVKNIPGKLEDTVNRVLEIINN